MAPCVTLPFSKISSAPSSHGSSSSYSSSTSKQKVYFRYIQTKMFWWARTCWQQFYTAMVLFESRFVLPASSKMKPPCLGFFLGRSSSSSSSSSSYSSAKSSPSSSAALSLPDKLACPSSYLGGNIQTTHKLCQMQWNLQCQFGANLGYLLASIRIQ